MTLQNPRLLYALIVLIALSLGSYSFSKKNLIGNNKRQAVFLTNGQVYFGKLSNMNKPVAELRDIYYIKAQEQLQTGESNDKKIALVKLGKELHGPEDVMYINREHILFYENMRDGSKINDAIQKYLETLQPSPTPSPAPTELPPSPSPTQ